MRPAGRPNCRVPQELQKQDPPPLWLAPPSSHGAEARGSSGRDAPSRVQRRFLSVVFIRLTVFGHPSAGPESPPGGVLHSNAVEAGHPERRGR